MANYKKLQFATNVSYVVTLLFNKMQEKEGEYGTFWSCGVIYNGEDCIFSTGDQKFVSQIEQFKKNDTIEIIKIQEEGDKYGHFEVAIQTQVGQKEKTNFVKPKINDDVKNDIHRQVALKEATKFFIAKKRLDYTEESFFIDLNLLVNRIVGVIDDKYNPDRPTEAEMNDLPF